MQSPAIVITGDRYATPNGKTAHGLVRGSDRFRVLAIVDSACAGTDAGKLLDGVHRDIPIVATLDEALAGCQETPSHCVLGVATHGGKLTPELRTRILEAVEHGLSIVNGLHDATVDDSEIGPAARAKGVALTDLRMPKAKHELHFWEGDIFSVRAPRVAVIGTDCALGKRTTTRLLVASLNAANTKAEMIYTGQTGWMQGVRYGFVLDSTLNDYVSGELEHAIVQCDRDIAPDVMVLEGQSALRNPSGPCGAELLLSADAHGVVLQHAPGREFFEGYESMGLRIAPVDDEIELIKFYGARTLAVTMNTVHMTEEAVRAYQRDHEDRLGIPFVAVLEEGLDRVVSAVNQYVQEERASNP